MPLSEKQLKVATLGDRDSFAIYVNGPVGSGKSHATTHGFLNWCGTMFSGHNFALVAASDTQWDNVIRFGMLEPYANNRKNPLRIGYHKGHVTLPSALGGVNRFWRHLGGKKGSERALEGKTFSGAYVDDALFIHPDFHGTLLDRLRGTPHAKIVYSMYPQSPFHPFWADHVQPARDGLNPEAEFHQFTHADNPVLPASYVQRLIDRWINIPHEYKRRVLGEPAIAEGLVFGIFEHCLVDEIPEDEVIVAYDACSDWASSSVTCGHLLARTNKSTYVVKEWRHDGRKEGILPTTEKIRRMHDTLTNNRELTIRSWVYDRTADGMGMDLRRINAALEVIESEDANRDQKRPVFIRWMQDHNIKILTSNTHLMRELGSHMWKDNATDRGEDQEDKASSDGAHHIDAVMDYCYTRSIATIESQMAA